jgi:hypothetical protein
MAAYHTLNPIKEPSQVMSAEFAKNLRKLGPRVRVAFRMVWLFIPVCVACMSFRFEGLRLRQARERRRTRRQAHSVGGYWSYP